MLDAEHYATKNADVDRRDSPLALGFAKLFEPRRVALGLGTRADAERGSGIRSRFLTDECGWTKAITAAEKLKSKKSERPIDCSVWCSASIR